MTASLPSPRLAAIAPHLRLVAGRFGTPVSVTDMVELTLAAEALTEAFPDPWLRSFSVKANDVSAIVARIAGHGFGANVVSRGEWAVARRAGVPDSLVTFEGIGKTDADLRTAVDAAASGHPPRWLAVESPDEVRALTRIARARLGAGTLDLLFRLNPAVVPDTSAGLAVGAASSKFGMTADELTAAVEMTAEVTGLVARGIHLHVGSQLQTVDAWRDAIRRALLVGALIRGGRPGFDTLDIGGGFPVAPMDEPVPGPSHFAREVPGLLDGISADRRPDRLAIEPGRFLVARAGVMVSRVLHVRDRDGRQVVLDTGMTEIIRPALYGARHDIVALTSLGRPTIGPTRVNADGAPVNVFTPDLTPAMVEGPLCESTDHLGQHRLPPLRRGDLVAILDTGAYAASLGSSYNGRPRPPQVILEATGALILARRRGSLAGLG